MSRFHCRRFRKLAKFFLQCILLEQMFFAGLMYSVHKVLCCVHSVYRHSFIRWYLADFLALIFCIPIFVNSQILFGIRKRKPVCVVEVIAYALLFSLYFEIIGPHFFPHFTSDFGDIVAYFLGGFVLYFSQKITI